MQLAKQDVIDVLRKVGLPELVDEALRVLPDPVDTEQLAKWGQPHGINLANLIDRKAYCAGYHVAYAKLSLKK